MPAEPAKMNGTALRPVSAASADRLRVLTCAAPSIIGARSGAALRRALARVCRQVLTFDALFVLAYDAETDTFQTVGSRARAPRVIPAAGTPAERVVREGVSLCTAAPGETCVAGACAIRSPMRSGTEVLGVLAVESRAPRTYAPDDVEIVEMIAALAGTALLNLRLARQRQAAEAALRASEESYRGLFDNLTELVYIQDFDGRFLNVNQAVLRAYGYEREELIGQTPALLADPERVDLDETMALFRRALEGEPQRFDWWGRRKDGSVFPKEVVLIRSTYFGQDVVLAAGRDISERIAAEAALRRSEEHFRRLIENASDLISILDADGIVRYQSPSITRLLGYAPEELVGQSPFDFLAPEDVEPTIQRWRELNAHPGTPVAAEFRFRHKDGSYRCLEAVGAALTPNSAGSGMIVNSRDITARKQAEAGLRLQKALLEAQGEASIDGILVVSDAGTMLSYNRRFVDMWSLPAEVVSSRSDEAALAAVLDQLVDPDAFLAQVDYLYARPNETARDEIALRDGRVFDRYSAPVVGSEGEYYGRIWFFRDVTAEKRHAAELEQARHEASLQAERLERELEFGRRIQQGLFPASLPQPEGWEIAVHFCPVWHVAGDFYDAFELPHGRVGLLVADVSGKGVGAALFMALFQSLLRASAERASAARVGSTPRDAAVLVEAVTSTNRYITRVHRHAHMFASVFFGLLDTATGVLHYVNGGHEPPVVLGRSGMRLRLEPTGPALGLLAGAPYAVGCTRLAPGEMLLAYTDGVTEARDAERAFFSEERLLALLERPPRGACTLLRRIERAVRAFTNGIAPGDDLTMLALRRIPTWTGDANRR